MEERQEEDKIQQTSKDEAETNKQKRGKDTSETEQDANSKE